MSAMKTSDEQNEFIEGLKADASPVSQYFLAKTLRGVIIAVMKTVATKLVPLLSRLDVLEARVENQNFERRISRHAEHLNSIETRLKRVERGE